MTETINQFLHCFLLLWHKIPTNKWNKNFDFGSGFGRCHILSSHFSLSGEQTSHPGTVHQDQRHLALRLHGGVLLHAEPTQRCSWSRLPDPDPCCGLRLQLHHVRTCSLTWSPSRSAGRENPKITLGLSRFTISTKLESRSGTGLSGVSDPKLNLVAAAAPPVSVAMEISGRKLNIFITELRQAQICSFMCRKPLNTYWQHFLAPLLKKNPVELWQ